MLVKAGKRVALSSTIGVVIGKEIIDTGFHVTTASSKLLQKLIRKIADRGVEYLVLEVTSHSIDQQRVLGCNFYISVFTNLTREHLDYHPSFEDYRDTKMRFLSKTPIAILNELDPSFEYIKSRCRSRVVGYTLYKGKVNNPKLPGKYNIQNLAAVEKVAEVLKIDGGVVKDVVKNFSGVEGRMEEVKNVLGFKIIVDFAHTPNALESVLKEVKGQTKGK
jgi:UDP-N-acetylmuramoyl-L-alanyl-D-glutamate--2,6-diaminopimelate ligase